jgi:spoIIIJ-associated protein
MNEIFEIIRNVIQKMGFLNTEISFDEEHRKISVVLDDKLVHDNIGTFLPALDHLLGLVFRKNNQAPFVLDINYYRRERERLIAEIARASAKKAMVTKVDVELPPMNGYERRLVHMEITTHPELRTESVGEGKERRVVIKHIE